MYFIYGYEGLANKHGNIHPVMLRKDNGFQSKFRSTCILLMILILVVL